MAVARNEADETGPDGQLYRGSKICHAVRGASGNWEYEYDPKKYDSPIMFTANDGQLEPTNIYRLTLDVR